MVKLSLAGLQLYPMAMHNVLALTLVCQGLGFFVPAVYGCATGKFISALIEVPRYLSPYCLCASKTMCRSYDFQVYLEPNV